MKKKLTKHSIAKQLMLVPSFLKKGDSVAIVAPARKITFEEIKAAIELFQSWGLKVLLGKNLFASYNQFSGTDIQRAEDMQWAMNHKKIKAIFCARGGYGCVRIIDLLDFSKFIKSPKWIVGFSDITAFHSHVHQLGVASLHAAMPYNIHKLRITNYELRKKSEKLRIKKVIENYVQEETLKKLIFGENLEYTIQPNILNRTGKAKGILTGGNLSILYSLSASASDIDTQGKILFIEDLDEYLYHIDRMMMNLKRSGKLAKLSGLIVGGMTDMKDNKVAFNKTAEQIIFEAVQEYDYPVCFNFPAGHIENNSALLLGANVSLEIGKKVILKFN